MWQSQAGPARDCHTAAPWSWVEAQGSPFKRTAVQGEDVGNERSRQHLEKGKTETRLLGVIQEKPAVKTTFSLV